MTEPFGPAGFFLHPLGVCESTRIGAGTRIWAFAHVLPGAVIGSDCNICDHVFIENDVVVGSRVTVKSGVQLWDGVRLADDVFVGPNATFTNDKHPRSRQRPERFAETRVGEGASIGANATILPGVSVGRGAMVGAGAVVTKDVPPNAVVYGNPARIHGYGSTRHSAHREPELAGGVSRTGPAPALALPGGATIVAVRRADDMRGSLAAIEFNALPFVPARAFTVFGVPSAEIRGEHAHRVCHQLLVCVAGSLAVLVDDGLSRAEVVLDDPSVALYLPPRTWGSQFGYSADAVLVVLASHPYDATDYVRDYEEFRALVADPPPGPPSLATR
jgi:UDP-2-acetamido-3-amino-2,3-dideoxy-glucuronate N-acetyltransferase